MAHSLQEQHVNATFGPILVVRRAYFAPSAIIDTFLVQIEQPLLEQWEYYSAEKKGYFVKFEIICSIGVPRVIWLEGPWKHNANDETISAHSTLQDQLLPAERLLADKAYRWNMNSFFCPISGMKHTLPLEDQTRNFLIHAARQTIERVIRRGRFWGFLKTTWRYSLLLLKLCVKVAFKLSNLFFIFEPV